MDFSSALPTFVITLREGVEAALVVGIVLAYLKKAKQRHLNSWVYGGIVVGLMASALVGVLFGWMIQSLGSANLPYGSALEPLLEGVFSLLAIAMLSWMLIWMTKHARSLKQEVEGAIGSALSRNARAGWGIFGLIFFAVLREGFETVLFIVGKFQQGLIPAIGALSGIAASAGIGVLLFKWGIKLNLRKFFLVMGVLLLLIVSGLVVTALGHFDTALSTVAQLDRKSQSLCFFYERFAKPQDRDCILGPMVWNFAKVLPDDRFPGAILSALFGYTQRLYAVQAVAYVVFLATIGSIYFQTLSGRAVFSRKASTKGVEPNSSKSKQTT
ncbi:MAG: FTR1 family iron permease [Myxacorys chilensis ATA2-1-KO14]|jgi:high-affinity iron transporter|nr:FTR1 family iron permease [Myxacorys chilensis ATA2-1-KO14]